MTTRTEGSADLPDSERQTYTVRETAAVMGLSLGVTYELLRQVACRVCGLGSAGWCLGSSWMRSWRARQTGGDLWAIYAEPRRGTGGPPIGRRRARSGPGRS